MTYDLRSLRLAGVIRRIPHTNRYALTDDGIRIVIVYTKISTACSVRYWPPTNPRQPSELRHALRPSAITSTTTSTRAPQDHSPKLDTNVQKSPTKER